MFRVGIAYLIFGWVLAQVADLVLDNIESPDWVMQAIMLVLALGFPLVLFFAWAFEVTPDGLKREIEVDRSKSITRTTGRKLERSITALLIVALAYFIWESRFQVPRDRQLIETAGQQSSDHSGEQLASSSPTVGKSIAVLPFENFSGNESDQYFADGLADTLLHKLAQISDLKVIARNSSFQFKGSNRDVREIGKLLGVETVLEGSVQRAGNQLRIIAQLINTDDGVHLWSQSFDDSMDNIFALQDRVASDIVSQLEVNLSKEEQERLLRSGTDNPEAYDLLMRALNHDRDIDELVDVKAETWEPLQLMQQALELDPQYAGAWASLARAYSGLAFATDSAKDYDRYVSQSRTAAEESLRLDPNLARGHEALGWVEHRNDETLKAAQHFRRALELNPNSESAMAGLGLQVIRTDPEEALRLFTRSHELDPGSTISYRQKHFALLMLGRRDEAIHQLELAVEADPDEGMFYNDLSEQLITARGRPDEAARQVSRLLQLSPASAYGLQSMVEAWVAAGEDKRASAWITLLMTGRSDSDRAKILNARLLVSATRYHEALQQLEDVLEIEDNAWQIVSLRTVANLGLENSAAAAEHAVHFRNLLIEMKTRGSANPTWDIFAGVLEMLTQEQSNPGFDAEAFLASFPPLDRMVFLTNAHYLHAGVQARRGNVEQAMGRLEQILELPVGGVFNNDILGFTVEESLLLNPLRGEPAFEDWLLRYRNRRDAMLERMITMENRGEIIEVTTVKRMTQQ